MDQDYYEGTDYLSPLPVDGDRTEELEYEVTITSRLCELKHHVFAFGQF